MRQLCVHRDMKYLESLESTQEARVALGYASSNSYASFVLSLWGVIPAKIIVIPLLGITLVLLGIPFHY